MTVTHTLTDQQVDNIKLMLSSISVYASDVKSMLSEYRDPMFDGTRDWDAIANYLDIIEEATGEAFSNLETKKRLNFEHHEQLS